MFSPFLHLFRVLIVWRLTIMLLTIYSFFFPMSRLYYGFNSFPQSFSQRFYSFFSIFCIFMHSILKYNFRSHPFSQINRSPTVPAIDSLFQIYAAKKQVSASLQNTCLISVFPPYFFFSSSFCLASDFCSLPRSFISS